MSCRSSLSFMPLTSPAGQPPRYFRRDQGRPKGMAKTKIEIDTSQTTGDLVDQLLQQHEMIRTAINGVARTTSAESRQEAFVALRELLARHETAEEMIVRPLTRDIDNGEAVAEARMAEENESKDVLK